MKIIELFIDPEFEEGGIDAISLVDRPAHESNFLTFNDEPIPYDNEPIYLGEMFTEDEQLQMSAMINSVGEPAGTLEAQGYSIVSIKPVHSLREELESQTFAYDIISTPNDASAEDGGQFRVRYKYQVAPGMGAPVIDTSRTFCVDMLRYNRVFRIEDIIAMTEDCTNEEFGCYDIMTFRGSYNCRHLWYKVLYRKAGPITGPARPIRTESPSWAQPSTQVYSKDNTIRSEFGILAITDGQPLFDNVEDALKLAELLGCEGYHEHKMGDVTGYMACYNHEFQSFDDYPQAATENACKVLKWIDEHGRDEVPGMTQTGLARANQLCNREPISQDTIARMASFARHRKNAEISEEYKGTPWRDNGYTAWMGWGGTEGIEWAERKLEQLKQEMGLEDTCWPGYEAIGTKIVDGREVPNCVPKEDMDIVVNAPTYTDEVTTGITSESVFQHTFSYDDDKMEITGAAMIPNKMIIRRNPITEEIFYVFFSKDTIKHLAERFMSRGYNVGTTNLDHSDIKAKDTFVTESWLVSDPQTDKSTALGLSYPEGTWVVTMKVKDKTLWSDIKNGKYKGYSVEGFFNERLVFN